MTSASRVLSSCVLLLAVAPFASRGEDSLTQSPEFQVSTPVVGEPSVETNTPVLTRGQDESLVVWVDRRDERNSHLYGAWVGSEGTPQGNTFLIGADVSPGTAPRVAFNGIDYLVVWAGREPENLYQWHLWGQRVSRSTGVREASPFSIASGEYQDFALATANGVWLVVYAGWGSDATKGDIFGVRVSAEGQVLDASPFPISRGANDEQQVAVGSNGTDFLLAWQDQYLGLRGVRVSPSGAVAATVTSLSSKPYYPAGAQVTSDGARFLVVWYDAPDYPKSAGLYGLRVDANGALVGTPFLISDQSIVTPWRAAFDGTRYMVVFGDWVYNDTGVSDWVVQAVRVGADGTTLDAKPLQLAKLDKSDLAQPTVAREGNGFRVAWDSGAGLFSRTVTTDGVPAPATTQLNRPFNSQGAPAVAFDGHQFLAVWEDNRSGVTNIFAARMRPDGTSPDGAGFPLDARPTAQRAPAVTFDGTSFVVAWEDERSGNPDIYAARVGTDGSFLDPDGFRVAGSPGEERSPVLASDGHGGVLAAWEANAATAGEVFGARISGGTVTPLSGSISGQASVPYVYEHGRNLTVSYGGGSYLVAWVDNRKGGSNLWGARVSASSGAVETAPFYISLNPECAQPVSAFDGTGFVVLWVGAGTSGRSFGAQRVSATGTLEGSSLALGDGTRPLAPPALTFDGSDFVVAWEVPYQHNLQSQSFSSLGTSTGFERLDPAPGSWLDTYKGLALATGPARQSLLVYTRYDSQPTNAFRLGARMLNNSGPSSVPDAGTPPTGDPEKPASGCGCTSASGGLWLFGALLAWAGAPSSRRKRA